MPQTLFKATGITAENSDKVKEAGSAVADVKWVNISNDNVVVTHGEAFDADGFISAVSRTGVSLSK